MLNLHNRRIYLCCSRVDMRKSFNGLTGIVLASLGCDPHSGDAFVFVGKRGNLLKVLVWDRDGFWCCAKKLTRGTFRPPMIAGMDSGITAITVSVSDWELLLDGTVVTGKRQMSRVDMTTVTAFPTA